MPGNLRQTQAGDQYVLDLRAGKVRQSAPRGGTSIWAHEDFGPMPNRVPRKDIGPLRILRALTRIVLWSDRPLLPLRERNAALVGLVVVMVCDG
jgi:hypothetical protein